MSHSAHVYTLSNPDRSLKRLPLPVPVQFDEKLYGLIPGKSSKNKGPIS